MSKFRLVMVANTCTALGVLMVSLGLVLNGVYDREDRQQLADCQDIIVQQEEMIHYLTDNVATLEGQLYELTSPVVADSEAESESDQCPLEWNFDYVTRVVAHECAGEPEKGQLLVAQVIRNRADEQGLTPEDIVKQPNQFATPWPEEKVTPEIVDVCERVFINGESVVDEPVKWFYSTRNGYVSYGHEKRDFVIEVGNHRFFK